jgi:hypothetical protein
MGVAPDCSAEHCVASGASIFSGKAQQICVAREASLVDVGIGI